MKPVLSSNVINIQSHYRFQRTQSRQQEMASWEDRIVPRMSILEVMTRIVVIVAVTSLVIVMVDMVL